jgi:hypothetical protein
MKIGMSCPDETSVMDPNNNFDAETIFFPRMRLTLIGKRTNDKWTSGKMGNGKLGRNRGKFGRVVGRK